MVLIKGEEQGESAFDVKVLLEGRSFMVMRPI
jgi:hypothetical protein